MSTTYGLPDPEDVQLLDHALREWHPRLKEAGVRVDLLMADAEDGPALKKAGYPCAATVRVEHLRYRIRDIADATVEIDRKVWDKMTERERLALLDHELSHLDLVEKDGPGESVVLQRDDLDRPKLRTIEGNWNGGDGFTQVIARHGADALEYQNAKAVMGRAADALKLGDR